MLSHRQVEPEFVSARVGTLVLLSMRGRWLVFAPSDSPISSCPGDLGLTQAYHHESRRIVYPKFGDFFNQFETNSH